MSSTAACASAVPRAEASERLETSSALAAAYSAVARSCSTVAETSWIAADCCEAAAVFWLTVASISAVLEESVGRTL